MASAQRPVIFPRSPPVTDPRFKTFPSVTVDELKDHLKVMAVFNRVIERIQPGGVITDPVTGLPISTPSTFLFISRAQHRFDLWMSHILKSDKRGIASPLQTNELPPLDVLMFLHAYMLNPWKFYEDCYRIYPQLSEIRFPLSSIRPLIDLEKVNIVPTKEQITFWESRTSVPFAIPFTTDKSETVDVPCPRCSHQVKTHWIHDDGTGFGQVGFTIHCDQCDLSYSRDSLCVAKFLKDAVAVDTLFARTLLNKSGELDTNVALKLSRHIRKVLEIAGIDNGDKVGWSISRILSILKANVNWAPLPYTPRHIIKAYNQTSTASLDIGKAVLRQFRFIRNLCEIGWCGTGSFEGENNALVNAIIRYRCWTALDTIRLVPAVDIDLVFHTHQLHGAGFRKDCIHTLGKFLNHDDSVHKRTVAFGYHNTEKMWEKRYGPSYGGTLCSTVCAGEDSSDSSDSDDSDDSDDSEESDNEVAIPSKNLSFSSTIPSITICT